jgi:hypothetical protein
VEAYLAAMGVGEPVMTLLRKTPAASIRWLSLAEIVESHMATEALDAAAPVLTSGANGLNGRALVGDPPRPDAITAKDATTGGAAEATLTFRRGGGAVEIAFAARDGSAAPGSWTLTGAGDPLHLQPAGAAPARAELPRERFCAIARSGKLVVAPDGEAPQEQLTLDIAALAGAGALVAEACP